MIDLAQITYTNWNERDIEWPSLVDFLVTHKDIETVLDVGANYSWYTYAKDVKRLISSYHGIDILFDEKTAAILDTYTVGNVLNLPQVYAYDLVFCISSIEHAGISTYHVDDYEREQRRVFAKMVDLAKKYIFITFPFGKEAFHEHEFANITQKQLENFKNIAGGESYDIHFYFSPAPQQKNSYTEVDIDFASNVEYKRELGTRCFCTMGIEL